MPDLVIVLPAVARKFSRQWQRAAMQKGIVLDEATLSTLFARPSGWGLSPSRYSESLSPLFDFWMSNKRQAAIEEGLQGLHSVILLVFES